MKRAVFAFLLIWTSAAHAQPAPPAPPPPPTYGWKHGLVAGLTLTQVAFTDWAQGGANALAYTTTADGKSVDDEQSWTWTNLYKFAFGQARLSDQGLRKTDDVIDLSAVLAYKADSILNPYGSASLKTQFAKGFMYNADGSSTQVSQFFDPAYLLQSAGAIYTPSKMFNTRLGIGIREIVTSSFNQYADDPTTPEIEKTSIEGGFESVTNVEWNMADNILFTTKLEMFDPIKHLDEVVVRSSTTITGKVNKYVTAIFSLDLINEKRVTPRTQVKESIALGLSYTLF